MLHSPPARGFSSQESPDPISLRAFPVSTGLLPCCPPCHGHRLGLPRKHGAAPIGQPITTTPSVPSQQARGCSGVLLCYPDSSLAFPASAGLLRKRPWTTPWLTGIPRQRGASPGLITCITPSRAALPASAGLLPLLCLPPLQDEISPASTGLLRAFQSWPSGHPAFPASPGLPLNPHGSGPAG